MFTAMCAQNIIAVTWFSWGSLVTSSLVNFRCESRGKNGILVKCFSTDFKTSFTVSSSDRQQLLWTLTSGGRALNFSFIQHAFSTTSKTVLRTVTGRWSLAELTLSVRIAQAAAGVFLRQPYGAGVYTHFPRWLLLPFFSISHIG